MTRISSTFKSAWLTPRTANYVAALIREGDNFDYCKWLQQLREKEAQAKERPQAVFRMNVPEEIKTRVDCREASLNGRLFNGRGPSPIGMTRSRQKTLHSTSVTQITRRLEKVRDAWNEFQANRARDAVYGYLENVFETVMHYKVRRKTKKLLRHAYKFAGLPVLNNADPFTAVIRCTSDGNADGKTISKWARALRYVARCKVAPAQLKAFMKEVGGINACADRCAKNLGRCAR
jgi:hypothetical protein